jgi:hypothetical protein
MTPEPALAHLDGPIHRVGRRPDAWAWPDWAYAHDDGTFGNRYDDPQAEYRVLYASSTRAGAFAETLARFRPDLEIAAELSLIASDADDDLDAGVLRRRAPRAFSQEISRYVFERARDPAGEPVAGVRYLSRLGDELVNWAIFETAPPSETSSEPISADDPDLDEVFERFHLAWYPPA